MGCLGEVDVYFEPSLGQELERGIMMAHAGLVVSAMVALIAAGGCATTRSAYYDAWEKLGYAKRQRLVDDVKAARDQQEKAKKQFASALDEFKSVMNFKGGDLEAMYNKLNDQYQACSSRADGVRTK